MSTRRQQQVAEFLREEISEIVLRELKDPRLGLISITRVEVSSDLRHAQTFVSVLGSDDEFREALKALNGASGFVRHLLRPRMHTRHIPEISFRADHSMEYAEQMARTLKDIQRETQNTDELDSSEDGNGRD